MARPSRISIYGLPSGAEDAPYVRISYQGYHGTSKIPAVLLPTSSNFLLPDLRWSLEDYATKEPFNTPRAQRTVENISTYTSTLIRLVLETLESPLDILGESVIIDLSDRWKGSATPAAVKDGANMVPLIYWECLEAVELWPLETKPRSVAVVRSTASLQISEEESPLMTQSIEKKTRILAVSARLSGDDDVPYRLITTSIHKVVRSLSGQDKSPELVIARPGTLDGLEAALRTHGPGHFDIVHIDVHGVATKER